MNTDSDSPRPARRRYSPLAMSAIVTALLALLLQGGFVPLNLAAAVLALLGLRQIRREPERYIGRAFCWLAIALVLVLAVLTALVEPTPSAPPAEFMVPEQNATER
ncbi:MULTISPECIES: hypothetical protein [unclassified Halomonas]|uniref:hypothetical protein n=1 Tax=unclassified Halomonas TaxID=2609666 RepID=UPI000D71D0B2|nr:MULTISPECIES: hypothetical protein [unclassified Halomonas]PWV74874.1 hypothetical protein DER72_11123 [Halomonas sp. A11-A]